MKMLYIVKTIVFLMSALLVAGFAFLFVKIAEKQTQSKSKNVPLAQVVSVEQAPTALSETESLISMSACGEFVCLLAQGHVKGSRLLIIQPKTGTIQNVLWLTTQQKSQNIQ